MNNLIRVCCKATLFILLASDLAFSTFPDLASLFSVPHTCETILAKGHSAPKTEIIEPINPLRRVHDDFSRFTPQLVHSKMGQYLSQALRSLSIPNYQKTMVRTTYEHKGMGSIPFQIQVTRTSPELTRSDKTNDPFFQSTEDERTWPKFHKEAIDWATSRRADAKSFSRDRLFNAGEELAENSIYIDLRIPSLPGSPRVASIRLVKAPFGRIERHSLQAGGQSKITHSHTGNFGPHVIKELFPVSHLVAFRQHIEGIIQQEFDSLNTGTILDHSFNEDVLLHTIFRENSKNLHPFPMNSFVGTMANYVEAQYIQAKLKMLEKTGHSNTDLSKVPFETVFQKELTELQNGNPYLERRGVPYAIRRYPKTPQVIDVLYTGMYIELGNFAIDPTVLQKAVEADKAPSYEQPPRSGWDRSVEYKNNYHSSIDYVQDLLFYYVIRHILDRSYTENLNLNGVQLVNWGGPAEQLLFKRWGFKFIDYDRMAFPFNGHPARPLVARPSDLRRIFDNEDGNPYSQRSVLSRFLNKSLESMEERSRHRIDYRRNGIPINRESQRLLKQVNNSSTAGSFQAPSGEGIEALTTYSQSELEDFLTSLDEESR